MKTRQLTGSEMLLAHCLWGPSIYPTLTRTRIIGERFSHAFIDELVGDWGFQQPVPGQEPVDGAILTLTDSYAPMAFLFCPADAGPAVTAPNRRTAQVFSTNRLPVTSWTRPS